MATTYRGWIEGKQKEGELLTAIGVKLGPWDDKLQLWSSCEVTSEVLARMDSYWGQFIWGLDPVEAST